jgi:hypothetical protein
VANHDQKGRPRTAPPADRDDSWRQQPSERPDEGAWSRPEWAGDDRGRETSRDPRHWSAPVHGDRHDTFERGSRSGSVEYRGMGQSGYGAGRSADPATKIQNWPGSLPSGSFEDRNHELDVDDRFTGRGRSPYPQDPSSRELGADPMPDSRRGRDFEPERRPPARRDDLEGRGSDRGDPRRGDGPPDTRLGYPAATYHGDPGRPTGEAHVHRGTGPHRGKGPVGYRVSDEGLRERVCESLADDDQLDASHIEVVVERGEVTLSGTVDDRRAKREAEDCASSVPGVRDVQNRLRVHDRLATAPNSSAEQPGLGAPDDTAMRDRHRS